MKTITRQQLIEKIRQIKGATFATLTTNTDARLLGGKKSPFAGCRKISKVNVVLNVNYENSVNRQLGREDKEQNFEAAARQWGEHETAAIIKNGEKLYVQAKCEKTLEVFYQLNSQILQKSEIPAELFPKQSESRQGTDKEVVIRSWGIDSIKAISLKGEDYVVVD